MCAMSARWLSWGLVAGLGWAALASTTQAAAGAAARGDAAVLAGAVVAPDGQSAANVEIAVHIHSEPPLLARTDEAGHFSLEAPREKLRGGLIVARGAAGLLGQAKLPYEFPEAGPLEPLVIKLQPARALEVVVTKQGAPTADVRVVVQSEYHTVAEGRTDAEGKVRLETPRDAALQFVLAAEPGVGVDYQLFRDAHKPASDPYQLPQEHAGPIALSLAPTRSVTVHVQDQHGQPLTGVAVTPWLIQMPKKGDSANLGSLWTQSTDAQGDAKFELIPQDLEHGVTFWARQPGLIATERSHLEPNDATGKLTATLLPLTPVSGRVLNADGSPAPGVAVSAAGHGYSLDDYYGETKTDAEGRFKFEVNPDCYCMFAALDKQQASSLECRTVRLGQAIDDLELRLAPATRIFGQVTSRGEPAADEYVSLYQEPTPDYYELPKDQQLPNSTDSRTGITPRRVQSAKTDADGRYEFFTGPGKYYYLAAQHLSKAPQFTIADTRAIEQNLALSAPPKGTLKGRVVLGSKPEQGVAGIRVMGQPENLEGGWVRATSDAEGRFEERRANGPSLFTALNDDRSLGALERVAVEQTEVTLELVPTATAIGALIDSETSAPAGGKQLIAYIRIGPENGPFAQAAEVSATTDPAGQFSLPGLIVDAEYQVTVVAQVDARGEPISWQRVTVAKTSEAGRFSLGEVPLPKGHRPATVDDDIKRAYSHPDAEKRLAQLLGDAELAYNQVLVVAASPAGAAGRRYFEICHRSLTGPSEERPKNLYEFQVLAVDPAKAGEFFARNKLPAPAGEDDATLTILNPDRSIVAQANSADLSTDGKLDAKLLGEFLANRRAPLPNARRLLREALEQAKQADKRVLVQVGGPGCGWCIVLGRYLQAHKPLIDKDYVHLKLDERMPEAETLISELRKNQQDGIPWMVILDADGKELITSDAPTGNIGYPGQPEGQAHWKQMLESTRKRLTDEDLATLLEALEKKK